MTVMRRWECPEHGETQLQFRGPLTTERVRVCPCGKEAVQVEYVLVEQLREGASRLERAGKAVAVELGFCDPDEWGTDECNREDRDTALRAAGVALDAANHTGAIRDTERLRALLRRCYPIIASDELSEAIERELGLPPFNTTKSR